MLPWILQSGIISLLLIFLIHYLFTFFKDNLTVPKTIDLVNKPLQQYEEILKNSTIKHVPKENKNKHERESMKSELKNYLNDLKGKTNDTTPIMEVGTVNNIDSYGKF
jgi:hypothetical protein